MSSKQLRVIDVAPHVPTAESRAQVEVMVACGLDADEVAWCLHVSPSVVRLQYAGELARGLPLVNARVGAALLKSAIAGDGASQRFWLQTRAKWVPAQRTEVTGQGGGAVEVEEKRAFMDSILELVSTQAKQETKQ